MNVIVLYLYDIFVYSFSIQGGIAPEWYCSLAVDNEGITVMIKWPLENPPWSERKEEEVSTSKQTGNVGLTKP